MPLPVDSIAVRGEWIRHAPRGSALLGRAEIGTSGRWQRGDVVRGLYLADDASTAVAEWYRWLAERALPPGAGIPHAHHRWNVALEVADLSSTARLEAVGLEVPHPSRFTWPSYQALGETLWREGWSGLLTPSAARPRARILCVFCDRWPPAGCWPASAEEIDAVPPPPVGMTT